MGHRILVFETTTSTNDVVQRLAQEGHPEGLVVFAESQSSGRGRHGRKWVSPSRKGLWFTVLARPRLSLQSASRLTVMVAVAVTRSLRRLTKLPLRIKWPNDILCNGRKVAGILMESGMDTDRMLHACLGIGINVNLERCDIPESLQSLATSLLLEAGQAFHRPTLAADILWELNQGLSMLDDVSFPNLQRQWMEWDETLGRQVKIQHGNGSSIHGQAFDLDLDGALLVRMDDGRVERVLAGDVTLQKELH